MENKVTTNDRVLALLRSRLELGEEKYGQDIPIQGDGGRNNQLDICTNIDKLIQDIKTTCKWDKKDEDKLIRTPI